MAKKQYAFYPGCSSQKKASADNFLRSIKVVTQKLDIQLNEIPDWNCCGASISYSEGGELPRLALSARNLALAEQNLPGQDMVSVCPACWLSTREASERLHESDSLLAETNEALREAGLQLKNEVKSRHFVEVLVEDVGFEEMRRPVVKELDGLKFAGYVGCQTNRPFGIAGESFENPQYLDKMVEMTGAEPIPEYDQKVTCCGGALAFSEPDKSQKQIRVEVYQAEINRKQGTKFAMPVVYYTQLMTVAYGGSVADAGLDGHVIEPTKLAEVAAKKLR
jgi:heterodisulfide reductase subunit B